MPRLLAIIGIAFFLILVSTRHASGSAEGHSCVGLSAPIDGVITELYAPIGRYSGHWGVDYSASAPGEMQVAEISNVTAAASGIVTFSGLVVDNLTVTIDHGGGLKTSYSYLSEASVGRGDWVRRGDRVGLGEAGGEHDVIHLSLRIEGVYVDPQPRIGCRRKPPSAGLNLVPPP